MRGRNTAWGVLALALCVGGGWALLRGLGDTRTAVEGGERTVASDGAERPLPPALAGAGRARRPSPEAASPRPNAPGVPAPDLSAASTPRKRGVVVVSMRGPGAGPPAPEAEFTLLASDGTSRTAAAINGSARFEEAPEGGAVVTVRSAAVHGRAEPFRIAPDDGPTNVTVHVAHGAPVAGRVLDSATSSPIPDARVVVRLGGSYADVWSCESGTPPVLETVRTDAEGRFSSSAQRFNEILTLDVLARGHARARVTTRLQPSEGERPPLEIRLGIGGAVHGRVVDAAGAPVPGVDVLVFGASWEEQRRDPRACTSPEGSNLPPRSSFEGAADADGRFTVDGVPFAPDWCATALTTGGRRAKDVCGILVAPGTPEPDVSLILPSGGQLEVRVLDPKRRPVTAGAVTIEGGPSGPLDPTGVARFGDLAAGSYVVHVVLDDFVPERSPVRIREGETSTETIVLHAGAVLSGVVVDEEGAPVPGIWVGVTRPASRITPEVHVDTDAQGTFRIGGLAREPYRVAAMGFRITQVESLQVTPPAEHLRLVVRKPPTVTVQLVLPAGTAAPASVLLNDMEAAHGGGSLIRTPWSDGPLTFVVQPGPRRLTWFVEGCAPVDREVTVPEGGNLSLGSVALDAGVTLAGDVVDGSGRPIAGAEVRRPEEWERAIQVPADGRFRFDHLRRGRVSIAVHAPGFVPSYVPRDLSADASPLHVVLEHGGVLRGRVPRYAAGARGSVRLLSPASPDGAAAYQELDVEGAFELRAPAGAYALMVEVRGRPTLRRDVVLREGGEETIDFDAAK